jgi:hypothetical protein
MAGESFTEDVGQMHIDYVVHSANVESVQVLATLPNGVEAHVNIQGLVVELMSEGLHEGHGHRFVFRPLGDQEMQQALVDFAVGNKILAEFSVVERAAQPGKEA